MGKHVPDEFVVLCEACGYDIDGLPESGSCPECARPISESKPGSRPGSLWQRRRTELALLRTWNGVLTAPKVVFSRAVPGGAHDVAARRAAHIAAAAVPVLFVAIAEIVAELAKGRAVRPVARPTQVSGLLATGPLFIAALIAAFFAGWGVLALLTWIEERGIRFWGPRRGWRITPAIARTICAHASVGWVLGSVLAVAGHLLGLVLGDIPNRHNLGIFRGPMQLAPITLPALGFLSGMLTFEVLVYIGMSQMKFANRARTADDSAGGQPSGPEGGADRP